MLRRGVDVLETFSVDCLRMEAGREFGAEELRLDMPDMKIASRDIVFVVWVVFGSVCVRMLKLEALIV
jgi:hypothetical protein